MNLNLAERFNLDTVLEAAILVVAAILAIKVFNPLFDVALGIGVLIIGYVAIRNRDLLIAKLKELRGDAQDLL